MALAINVVYASSDDRRRDSRGFTLIELLLSLLIVALLASLVTPVVVGSIHRARESALKEDLYAMRKAIDDYYADAGTYPTELDELVTKRYLRRVPVDPITEKRDTWVFTRTDSEKNDKSGKSSGIVDVRSGSKEKASDGSYYKDW